MNICDIGIFRRAVLACIWLGCVCFARSQDLGNWTLNNTLSGSGTPFNTVGSVSLGPAISSGSFNGGVEYFGQDGWPLGAINTNAYIQFSIAPVSGYELHLSRILLRIRRSSTGSPAGSGPLSWCLRSSRDGFASNLITGTITHAYGDYPVPLTAFSGLNSVITFRLYGYNATITSGGNNRFVLDNISIQGITALLPLSFLYITAIKSEDEVLIKTGVAKIEAGTKLSLEKSTDGIRFVEIATQTEQSNRNSADYLFKDPVVSSAYYRIKSIDNNSLIKFSKTIFIENKIQSLDEIKPRMINATDLIITSSVRLAGEYQWLVYSADGSLVLNRKIYLNAGNSIFTFNLPAGLPGIYVLQVKGNKVAQSCRFLKPN